MANKSLPIAVNSVVRPASQPDAELDMGEVFAPWMQASAELESEYHPSTLPSFNGRTVVLPHTQSSSISFEEARHVDGKG